MYRGGRNVTRVQGSVTEDTEKEVGTEVLQGHVFTVMVYYWAYECSYTQNDQHVCKRVTASCY